MKPRSWIGLAFSLATILSFGCGGATAQVGLANVPSLNQFAERDGPYDVVANGSDSCQRNQNASRDPLHRRLSPCAGSETTTRLEARSLLLELSLYPQSTVARERNAHTKDLPYARLGDIWPRRRFCYNYGARGRCLDLGFAGEGTSVVWSSAVGSDHGGVSTEAPLLPLW
jgi:hypothetical protein